MFTILILFFISLFGIGVLVGHRLHYAPTQTTMRPWYSLDLHYVQKIIWGIVVYISRGIVVFLIVYPLLFIEKAARYSSRKLHIFLEKKLHYYHNHD